MYKRESVTIHHAQKDASRYPGGEWFAVGPGGRYLGMEPLRRGGAAAPYRGWDRLLHRVVVLKVLPEEAVGDDWRVLHLRREGEAASSFRHPALAQVLDCGEDAGRPFLVYEYFPGGSLADAFRAGSLRLPRFAAAMRRVGEALAYLHGKGWVHADLKPANILFDEQGQPRLADFGLARPVGEPSGENGQVIASAPYAPPEQRAGEPLTPAADVYSLCAVLHEGFMGRRWTGKASSTPGLAASVGLVWEETIHRGLADDPGERFADAVQLLRALDRCDRETLPPAIAARAVAPLCNETATAPRRMPSELVQTGPLRPQVRVSRRRAASPGVCPAQPRKGTLR